MVRIDCASSVPPHIQPPIAQVPKPMRETTSDVSAISMDSMRELSESAWVVEAVEVISSSFAVGANPNQAQRNTSLPEFVAVTTGI